jgi:hypothetical protein
MAEEDETKPEKRTDANRVQLTSGDLVRLIIAAPVAFCWLFLASRIILSATTSETVLNNIEPLLTVLAVLTIPVTGILQNLFSNGGDKK